MAARRGRIRSGWGSWRCATMTLEKVLIHDAVRPFVDAALIDRVIAAIDERQAPCPPLPVADTLKRADADELVSDTCRRRRPLSPRRRRKASPSADPRRA